VGSAHLVGADLMLKTGRADAAAGALNALRSDLYALRKASGIVVLADCVRDANAAADALMVYDDAALDWSKPETRFAIAARASIYGYLLARCDDIASDVVRKSRNSAADRWRPCRPRLYPHSNRHPRHKPVASRVRRTALV